MFLSELDHFFLLGLSLNRMLISAAVQEADGEGTALEVCPGAAVLALVEHRAAGLRVECQVLGLNQNLEPCLR